ncbi:MAG: chemotaxis protein CheX [Elusimicrobiales bacterium]
MSEVIDITKSIEDIVKEVFATMLSSDIEVCEDDIKEKGVGVSVFLGIAGKRKYIVLIESEESFALKAAGSMLMEEITEWSDAVGDAFSEIANMISGNIKSRLPEHLDLSLSLPAVIKGKDYAYSTPRMKEVCSVCFKAFGDKKMRVKLIEEV